MPIDNGAVKLAYYQDPAWDDPGLKLDKDASVDPKTGAVDHADSAASNLLEVVRAPLAALSPGNLIDSLSKGNTGQAALRDLWEIIGLPIIMAKDLVDAAVHGIAAGFSKADA